MNSVEALGVLDVCAAGNSGVNTDASPMYPAAYSTPGIISVAASDSGDAAPYWTNYGLATVDIAAPGVSTFSTLPTTACTLCDTNGYGGYGYLSGTSMATPHVTGVAAALFQVNPNATAAQMRGVILDPGSYDKVSDPILMQSATVGGRLNFYKALTNPLLKATNPQLDQPPTVTVPASISAGSGSNVTLQATTSDPDNDPLTVGWTPQTGASAIYQLALSNIFPAPGQSTNNSPVSFTAPSVARTALAQYIASVADGRGGSATASTFVQILAGASKGIPTGSFTASPTSISAGDSTTLTFNLTDPDGDSPLYWQAWFLGPSVWGEMCCLSASTSTFGLQMSNAGVYRVSVQGIDSELNLSPKYSTVVNVGGGSGTPPIAAASVSPLEGAGPLTVNINMSGSTPGSSAITTYGFYCPDGLAASSNPTGTCTFTSPGTYYLWMTATDKNGLRDAAKAYITVLPSGSAPSPDFSISASPSSQAVTVGNNTQYTVATTASGGFTGSTSLKVASGLPAGATASFSPTSITGSGSSTLTVTAGSSTAPGTYTLTITGTSGSLSHSTTATLVVNAAPDFSMSAGPSSQTVAQGSGTSYTVSTTALNGFSAGVNLTVAGVPSGATAGFNPTSVTGSGSSMLSVTTASSTPAGSYTLTITGTSGSLKHTASVTLVVNPAAGGGSLSVKAASSALTVNHGSTTSTTITVSAFSSSVSLTVTGLPNGSSATFSPASGGASSSGWNSSLSIKTSNGTKSNSYRLTVTATGGGATATVPLTLTVN
jgi:hypothetical protein